MVLNRLTQLNPLDDEDNLRMSLSDVTAIVSDQSYGAGNLIISEQL
jgi:hypothetical protein